MNLGIGLVMGLSLLSSNVYLIPGGENIAFEVKTDGIIVTSTYDVKSGKDIYNPSKHSDINKGDIIKGVEGYKVDSLESFINIFNRYIDKGKISVNIVRKGKKLTKTLRLIKVDEKIKTGLYVKERILGIGTISFYDPENHIYGALGHEIYDPDSDTIVDVKSGSIYESNVIGIKNNNNDIGEKIGSTELDNYLGDIQINSEFGIFGSIEEIPSSYVPIEMAKMNEVKIGKAKIHTVTKGSKIEEYEIKITSLKKQSGIDEKGIAFTITDKKLLDIGGGIYYGMSGSPIIQNNKLVGAVTHVLANDITSGYGIYMESMYQYALNNL